MKTSLQTKLLTMAFAATFGAALVASHTGGKVCRIVVIDATGNEWIAGQGDNLADASQGAVWPQAARQITFPGCY